MPKLKEMPWFQDELQHACERSLDKSLPPHTRRAAEHRLWTLVQEAETTGPSYGAEPFSYNIAIRKSLQEAEKQHYEQKFRQSVAARAEDLAREERSAQAHEQSIERIKARETL